MHRSGGCVGGVCWSACRCIGAGWCGGCRVGRGRCMTRRDVNRRGGRDKGS